VGSVFYSDSISELLYEEANMLLAYAALPDLSSVEVVAIGTVSIC
jgi:hypothetical protein